MKIEKATIADVPQIHRLIDRFAQRGEMGPRSTGELYENIRDFFVARDSDEVVGCAALHIRGSGLAEIRAGAVAERRQGQGLSASLLNACLEEARSLGIQQVFCLTRRHALAEKLGFHEVDVKVLAREV
jgi:amino-acid N-acetyltransferase